jgi:hypothetical protein
MYARDLAKIYYSNGYKPIPADADKKIPRVSGFYDEYDFDKFWHNWLDCDIALVLDGLVCVDFDKHGSSPNGRDYFDKLMKGYPAMFDKSIIEETQSGGIHAYFRHTIELPDKEWHTPIKIDGKIVEIEVKTGRRLAFCYPSKKNNKIAYKLINNSFESFKLKDIKPLPTVFRHYKPAQKIMSTMFNDRNKNSSMTPGQMDKAIDIIVDNIYGHNARHEGDMNKGAYGMTCYMAGLGYSSTDIRRALQRYESNGHRTFRKKEIEDLITYGMRNADKKAIPPWKHLKKVSA